MLDKTVTDLSRGIYRRIYAGFIKGQRINKLSLPAEAWFWRVIASADDFGNAEADPDLCRDATVGRRRDVTAKQIGKWLTEMLAANLISFYEAKGERYLHVTDFEGFQPAGKNGKRIKRFPGPDESGCIQVNPDVSSASDSDTYSDTYSEDDTDTPFHGAEFLAALVEFEQHRKEKKVRVTPTARRRMFKKFETWGEDRATAALLYSTEKGYTGVFEERSNGHRARGVEGLDAVKEVLAEMEHEH